MHPRFNDRSPSVVVWAPGHDELDRRVNRVVEVLGHLGARVAIVYDDTFAGRTGSPIVSTATICLLKNQRRGVVAAFLGIKKWLSSIDGRVDLLYIHDSGLFGLMLAVLAARRRRGIRIVFDYHDWIPWEIWYQWSKLVHWSCLARGLAQITQHLVLPWLGKGVSFRGIVGISPAQLVGLRESISVSHRVPGITIPNTRRRLPEPEREFASGALTLLWVGNIMEGRDLDLLLDYVEALRRDVSGFCFSVLIIGKVLSVPMLLRLKAVPYVRHVAGFSNDGNLLELVAKTRAVGVFLGWNDVAATGINQVASPNKVYSYVNIGIPVIYARSLEAVGRVIPEPAGMSVGSFIEFREAVLSLDRSYSTCVAAVRELRKRIMWDDEAKDCLEGFLAGLLGLDHGTMASDAVLPSAPPCI